MAASSSKSEWQVKLHHYLTNTANAGERINRPFDNYLPEDLGPAAKALNITDINPKTIHELDNALLSTVFAKIAPLAAELSNEISETKEDKKNLIKGYIFRASNQAIKLTNKEDEQLLKEFFKLMVKAYVENPTIREKLPEEQRNFIRTLALQTMAEQWLDNGKQPNSNLLKIANITKDDFFKVNAITPAPRFRQLSITALQAKRQEELLNDLLRAFKKMQEEYGSKKRLFKSSKELSELFRGSKSIIEARYDNATKIASIKILLEEFLIDWSKKPGNNIQKLNNEPNDHHKTRLVAQLLKTLYEMQGVVGIAPNPAVPALTPLKTKKDSGEDFYPEFSKLLQKLSKASEAEQKVKPKEIKREEKVISKDQRLFRNQNTPTVIKHEGGQVTFHPRKK